jgi:uroporphyrinogen decarboxylase
MKLSVPDDVSDKGIIPIQKEFFELSLKEDLDNVPWKIVFQLEGTFNMANNMVGTVNLQRWTIKNKDAAHHVLRIAADYQKKLLDYWKATFGTEGVLPWGGEPSASNQLISPKTFEQFVLPYIREVHEYALSLGYGSIFKHICGEQNKNLPFWAQIPMGNPGFLSFGHEVDLLTAAEYFPNDVIIGNIEPAALMIGTPEDVYEKTRLTLEKGKQIKRGFVLAPGCDLPPVSPVENIQAMTRAVQDHGWY